MKIYLLTQNETVSYNTYVSCVVVAESKEMARKIHPTGCVWDVCNVRDAGGNFIRWSGWNQTVYKVTWATKPENVKVEFIGFAKANLKPNTVLCASLIVA